MYLADCGARPVPVDGCSHALAERRDRDPQNPQMVGTGRGPCGTSSWGRTWWAGAAGYMGLATFANDARHHGLACISWPVALPPVAVWRLRDPLA
jgi:hypothetical protein